MGDAILLKCKCGANCGRELLLGKVTPVEFTLHLVDREGWEEHEVVTDTELSERIEEDDLLWVNDDTLGIVLPAQDLEELKTWAGL